MLVEMQPFVLLGQFFERFVDVFRRDGRRIVRLFGKGEHDAFVAVDLGVDFVGIVGHANLGHIRKIDRVEPVQPEIEQKKPIELFFGQFIADTQHR